MGILFSREGEYTVQALCFLALKPEGRLVSIRELTDELGIPYFFLGKILQKLARRRILLSRKGPNGGFALAIPAENISLYDILEAMDGAQALTYCAIGFKQCSDQNCCAVHHEWRILREGLTTMLKNRNILAIARESNRSELANAHL